MLDRLSASERRGIATASLTVCLAFLAWAFPNMTRLFTIPGAICFFGLTVYFLWPEITSLGPRIAKYSVAVTASAALLFCAFLGIGIRLFSIPTPDPLIVHGHVVPLDAEDGVVNSGITWHPGYAHSVIFFSNATDQNIFNLNVLIQPNTPVIKSTATANFAVCRIGPAARMPVASFIVGAGGNKIVSSETQDDPNDILISPMHRLVCDKIPARTDVQVVLATVVLTANPTMGPMYRDKREDLKRILFRVAYELGGKSYNYTLQMVLAP
jgi:hypothetical protein